VFKIREEVKQRYEWWYFRFEQALPPMLYLVGCLPMVSQLFNPKIFHSH